MQRETKTLIYTGASMRRVFEPGDLVTARPARFEDLKKGDIVVCNLDSKIPIIHRVVFRDASRCVTMGDNNSRPDRRIQRPSDAFLIAVERIPKGKRPRRVKNGAAGWRQFLWNRARRRLRNDILSPAFSMLVSLAFWRIGLHGTDAARGFRHWHWRGRLIAYRRPDGRTLFRSPLLRLFFRLGD